MIAINAKSRAFARIMLTVFTLLALNACSSGTNKALSGADSQTLSRSRQTQPAQSVAAPALAGQLPSPSTLLRAASGGAGDRLLQGSEFDNALPKARVFATGESLSYAPAGSNFAAAAFAVYHFNLPGYAGGGSVQTNWGSPPNDADLFYGVADYGKDAWHWFKGDTAATVSLPGALDFLSPSDQAYVVVLITGSAVSALSSIRFGGDQPPVAVIHPNYYFADEDTEFVFDASASSDDNAISTFEWDLDGDGTFEVNTGNTPLATKTYPLAATRDIKVRVTDDAAQSTVATATITIDAPGYDEVEPNNLFTAANELPGVAFQGWEGSLGASGYDGGNQDFYTVHVSEPANISFNLSYSSADTSMYLELYDGGGNQVLRSGSLYFNGTILTYRFDTPGDYILLAAGGDFQNDYLLSATADYGLDYDEVESNDNHGAANSIAAPVNNFLGNLGPGGNDGDSDDYFSFPVTAGHAYSFNLATFNADAELHAALENQASQILLKRDDPTAFKKLGLAATATETVFFHVYQASEPPPGFNSDYSLSIVDLGQSPIVNLQVSPNNGAQPLDIELDASGSTPTGSAAITEYWWDVNNDGLFEQLDNVNFPQWSATLFAQGSYTPRVRVYQDDGSFGEATTSVNVTGVTSEVEPNNDSIEAQVLSSFPLSNFYGSCGPGINIDVDGDDYFTFTTVNASNLSITLNYQKGFAPMFIVLADDSLNPLALDSVDDGTMNITYTTSPLTKYYFAVITSPDAPGTSGYLLSVNGSL